MTNSSQSASNLTTTDHEGKICALWPVVSDCWQLWILNWLQRDNWWCNESLLVNALVVSRLHERCHLVCRHSHISYQVVVKLKSAMVKKKSALSFRKSWAVLKFVGYSSKAPLLLWRWTLRFVLSYISSSFTTVQSLPATKAITRWFLPQNPHSMRASTI